MIEYNECLCAYFCLPMTALDTRFRPLDTQHSPPYPSAYFGVHEKVEGVDDLGPPTHPSDLVLDPVMRASRGLDDEPGPGVIDDMMFEGPQPEFEPAPGLDVGEIPLDLDQACWCAGLLCYLSAS